MYWECVCKRKCICRDPYTSGFRREMFSSCSFFRRLTFFSSVGFLRVATWMETNHCTWPQSEIESAPGIWSCSSGESLALHRCYCEGLCQHQGWTCCWRYLKNVETLLMWRSKFRNGYNNTATCRSYVHVEAVLLYELFSWMVLHADSDECEFSSAFCTVLWL